MSGALRLVLGDQLDRGVAALAGLDPAGDTVLMVEAMAQSAAVLTSLTRNVNASNTYYLFMGIEKVRFKTPLTPGKTLHMRVEKVRDKMDVYEYTGTAYVEGKLAATASFTAKLMKK